MKLEKLLKNQLKTIGTKNKQEYKKFLIKYTFRTP